MLQVFENFFPPWNLTQLIEAMTHDNEYQSALVFDRIRRLILNNSNTPITVGSRFGFHKQKTIGFRQKSL